MRHTPYGYCMCVGECPTTCAYPDCRVGDMLAGYDDGPHAGQQPTLAAMPYDDADDLAPPRGILLGVLLSAAIGVSVWLGWSMAQWWGP